MAFRAEPQTREWIEHRFRHWLAFTLPSVLDQSEGDFRYWLVCDPRSRAVTEPLRARIRDERVELVYADEWPDRLRGLPRRDRYLLARLDSDDLYHPNVASNLLRRPTDKDYFQFNRGYACDFATGEVRDWISRSSPFYCRVHGDEVRSQAAWEVVNHTRVRQRACVLGPGHFLVTLHGRNTSTTIAKGRTAVRGPGAVRVLRSFGLDAVHDLAWLRERAPHPIPWSSRAPELCRELRPLRERFERTSAAELPLEAAALLVYLCELTDPRRVLVLGAGFATAAARAYAAARGQASCEVVDRWPPPTARPTPGYDVVLADARDAGVRDRVVEWALGSALATGIVLLAGVHPGEHVAGLEGWLADRYHEVSQQSADSSGGPVMLLGRPIPGAG